MQCNRLKGELANNDFAISSNIGLGFMIATGMNQDKASTLSKELEYLFSSIISGDAYFSG